MNSGTKNSQTFSIVFYVDITSRTIASIALSWVQFHLFPARIKQSIVIIFLFVYSRYYEYYRSPMEQMHERCENYPPCDYLSDQIGFSMAYNRFFGRY
uniref:Gla domain-containing protein n=1 Tax=Amazona collaria TaxID=241587 RepID=A0A8B9FD64_9PSIT